MKQIFLNCWERRYDVLYRGCGMSGFLDYFQFTVFLLYIALFVGRIIYLNWQNGIRAITVTVDGSRVRGILTVCLIAIITIWFVVMISGIVNPEVSLLPSSLEMILIDSVQARIAGVILVILGFVVFTSAWFTLGNAWRVGNREEDDGELITHGIYAVSRNPIYLFFILYLAGSFLINGDLIFLILTVLIVLNLHYLTLEEEAFLSRAHGLSFRDYCTVTGRYITWLKIWPMSRLRLFSRCPECSE
ncbi:MAG: isoprenylcysteine carboxylmethyltransferase family protein [Dehalococcoidales bacterium]|nr:isoprenylcysteine carboxylmethyltransferase family protein [Dehalococcoidales bacterium]